MIKWRAYLSKGLLKELKPNFKQIANQITRAEKDLTTFDLVVDADPEWAATIAYQAMLRAGRALLYAHGYLPADGQQHKTVVTVTGELLGDNYKLTVRQFDRFRKKRNTFFYESKDARNKTEARSAHKTAAKLIHEIKFLIRKNDSQGVFDWK